MTPPCCVPDFDGGRCLRHDYGDLHLDPAELVTGSQRFGRLFEVSYLELSSLFLLSTYRLLGPAY